VDALTEEQAFVDLAYDHLAGYAAQIEQRIDSLRRSPSTGTNQDLLEKQALFDSLNQQRASAEAARRRLCFGRTDSVDGQVQHIGRIGLRDANGDPVLLDWRAPTAAGFYQATSVDPMGLRSRRRILMRDRQVTHLEDEDLLDPSDLAPSDAAAHAMSEPRDGRMADIVATIAADQDRIVRSPLAQVTVVQGGPGTGKTVVALHRAAWLLYTYRDRLAKDGVLVVGPSTTFLRYIDQVLPSLGETDVVLLTPGQLFPDVSTDLTDNPECAAVKGDLLMAKVIANAVRLRIRVPDHDVTITMADGTTARVTFQQLDRARRSVPRNGTFHANREPFLVRVLDSLSRDRAIRKGHDPEDPDVLAEMLAELVDDPAVRRTLNLMWLPTRPERLVAQLLSDAETLRRASDGLLTPEQQRCLLRPPGSPWTVDDVPLLDEAADRLGEFVARSRPEPRVDDGYAELSVTDPFARDRPTTTVAERALADRDWVYGHVIVDEAQELSRMAWRALARRCTRRSMTVVGDLQQTTHPAGARDWGEALEWAGERVDLHRLTVTYRITRQTAETATALLAAAGGDAPDVEPIRSGPVTEQLSLTLDDLATLVRERAAGQAHRTVIVVPDSCRDLIPRLTSLGQEFGAGEDAVDAAVAVLDARSTKGLEFDEVYVVNPRAMAQQGTRGSDVYVACTRATQQLHLVTLAEADCRDTDPVARLS
jgi:DNA helicase IV